MLAYDGTEEGLLAVSWELRERTAEDYRVSGYRASFGRESGRLVNNGTPDLTIGEVSFSLALSDVREMGVMAAIRDLGTSGLLSPAEREHALRSAEQLFAGVVDCQRDLEGGYVRLFVTYRGYALQTLLESVENLPDRVEIEAREAMAREVLRLLSDSAYVVEPF